MSLLALLAASVTTDDRTPVTPAGPTWLDDADDGGGTWTTPTEEGLTYSPASGVATPGQVVTVTATADEGYRIVGTATWTHTFPTAAVPYQFPTAAPYNVPVAAITPTYDNSGEGIHPDVIDFTVQHGAPAWNGHRYWMGMTPYTGSAAGVENPSILASDDGYTWVVPPGLTNPIDPAPGSSGYNSDTDLEYDPATGRLWCFWREHNHSGAAPLGELMHAAWSTDGSTWTKIDNVLVSQVPGNEGASGAFLSPAVSRRPDGTWALVSIGRAALGFGPRLWTAPAPTGPWTEAGAATFTWTDGTSPAGEVWHFGMALVGGVYYGLIDINGGTEHVYPATSTDGLTWAASTVPVIEAMPGQWDARPYRACLTPHEDGTRARVWYSTNGSEGWRTGYTQAPLTAWPEPPA